MSSIGILALEDVKTLGTELLTSKSHINNLPRLLALLAPSSPPDLLVEALLSLQPFFVTLLPEIHSQSRCKSRRKPGAIEGDAEVVFREWLRSRFDEFVKKLIEIALSPTTEECIKDVMLDGIMEFVKLGKEGNFQTVIYRDFIYSLVNATTFSEIFNLFAPKFFKYMDVRYFTYTSITKVAERFKTMEATDIGKAATVVHQGDDAQNSVSNMDAAIRSMFTILSRIPHSENEGSESLSEMWSEFGSMSKGKEQRTSRGVSVVDGNPKKLKNEKGKPLSIAVINRKLKAKFSKAWMSFLKLSLPLDVYKEVLVTLHEVVIPNIADPLKLCDFLTKSYDIGGLISVMALNGLYILITQHGLEYPNYYTKLYSLVKPSIFLAKYRARFFELLDASLKSTYVPAYLAAAFGKKLSRLVLYVPPSGSLIIIALIHNLLRRHPSINFLVQKSAADETVRDSSNDGAEDMGDMGESDTGVMRSNKEDGVDSFDIEESDPVKSNAMRSSLWEIDTLRHHYCPAVSRFVASLENDLTVREKTSEVAVADFVSGSYSTIFGQEVGRRIKQVPLSFYKVIPTSLFSESDFVGWSFGSDELADKHDTYESVEQQDTKRQKINC